MPWRREIPRGLTVDGLSYRHAGSPPSAMALDGVSFTLAPGRLLAVVGHSGAGKSTLLSLIAGFERAQRGTISCGGARWDDLPPAERGIGLSFDDAALHEHLTVAENLDAAARARNEPRERRAVRIQSVADTLGIASLLTRKPATLSAGERRRAAIGRAFIASPSLVLLDEPFANLDRGNRFTVRRMVHELQRTTGATAILVTHDPTDALAIADDLLVLIGGRVRAHGAASEIATAPPDLEVAQLVDDLGMHVVELQGGIPPSDCLIEPRWLERARTDAGEGDLLLGVRPWHLRLGDPRQPSIAIDARVVALEPAGVFVDVIARRANGRALRARVPRIEAQDLPTGANARFHIHEEEIHLFHGVWPGRRVR